MKVCQKCGLKFYLHIEQESNSSVSMGCKRCPACGDETIWEEQDRKCDVCKRKKSVGGIWVAFLRVCDNCSDKLDSKQEVFEKKIKDVVEDTLIVEEL